MKFKKYLLCFLAIISIIGVAGCATEEENLGKDDEVKEEAKGKCSVTECIKQLKVTNTVEEIDEIIGFEGEKSDYSENFTWKLDKKNWITLDMTGTNPILQATIDKESVKSDKVDFSVYSDIKKLLDKGKTLSYDELVEKMNGVEGVLAGKTSTSDRYIWVDKNNQTFSATIRLKDNMCSIISLR